VSDPTVESAIRDPQSAMTPEDLDVFIRLVHEALSHALGAAHLRPPRAGSDLHVALWHLAKAERDAQTELSQNGERETGNREPDDPLSNPQSAIRNPQFVRPACNVIAEIPPGGQISCGPLRIRRPDIGSDVVIELGGEIRINAILASAHVRIRTDGRWYPEVQASEADLPLALFGQGDTQREIRPEDV